MLTLEVNEKEQTPLWVSESVLWTCAFTNEGTLRKLGITTSCRRNSDNLNCFEVRSQYITIATMNLNFSAEALTKIYIRDI